jgi:hypothetical protein
VIVKPLLCHQFCFPNFSEKKYQARMVLAFISCFECAFLHVWCGGCQEESGVATISRHKKNLPHRDKLLTCVSCFFYLYYLLYNMYLWLGVVVVGTILLVPIGNFFPVLYFGWSSERSHGQMGVYGGACCIARGVVFEEPICYFF